MDVFRVENDQIWSGLRIVFLGALALFLVNIYFGFDNSLTVGELPRWQQLIHLHAGSIGWVTLSAIGLAVWVLNSGGEVDPARARSARRLMVAAVIVFAGYVPNFWLAFSRGQGPLVALLPIFGAGAVIVLWASAIYALGQLRRKRPASTIHTLAAGALLVAAIGATVGMLLGLERAIGQFLPLPQGEDRVAAHAGMMDTYLFLAAAAIIEWFTREDPWARRSWGGLVQALAWTIGATLVPIAFFTGTVEVLLPIFLLLLLIGLIAFLIRVGWRAVLAGPGGEWPQPWTFFGSLWLVVYMAVFLYAIPQDFATLPSWFGTLFAHSAFVGTMTNLILALISARAQASRHVVPWGEAASMWLINLGLLAFVGLKIVADIRLGALVMGVGVLLGVYTMARRLWADSKRSGAAGAMAGAGGTD